ncbi:MAG TPA: type IV pilus assembly protein PilM [Planctomycetota bacterium]
MAKGIWGIDVSKSSAKAVRLEGGVLTQAGVFPYDGVVGEGADLDAQIKDALLQIKQKFKISSEPVVLSLPSHSTFNRLIKLPPVEDARIPETVKYEATSQIPFQIDEVIWDYQVVERDYQPGEEKEVILFAVKKEVVEEFLANLADLKLNVEAVQFAPVALFNFLVADQDLQGPIVALDMGGDNTDLIVVDGTKFWVRNLPITGNQLTRELAKGFNIPFEEAEKLKLKAGTSQQAQKIFNVLQPVLRDLVNEMNRSMGYYKSISKISKFDRVVLLGNSTKTLNFQRFVGQSLQLPVSSIDKLSSIAVGGAVNAGELKDSLPTLGTAIGLALQGAGQTVNKVNLLPQQAKTSKEIKKKQPFIIGAVAALYVLVALLWMKQNGEIDKLNASVREAKNTITRVNDQNERYEKAKTIAHIKSQLDPLSTLALERDLALRVMDQINPNIPNNGEAGKSDDKDKMWVVDWKVEEREKPKPAEPGYNPGSAGPVHYPTQKLLTTVLEVCITKRQTDVEGRGFIVKALLNYNESSKKPQDPAKPCPIANKAWDLGAGQGVWRVELDHAPGQTLAWPVPKSYTGESPEPPAGVKDPPEFWRYRVTIEMPVGEEARKPAPAPKPETK